MARDGRVGMRYVVAAVFVFGMFITSLITKYYSIPVAYEQGFEAGKNFVPASMQRADSLSVVYYGNKPMVSDHIKMPRDSVQLVIDNFMGKPKQYLLMTLKLVTKEK